MKNKLLYLLLVLLATACKKTDRTVYLSDNVKTKFSFKPGSYWIYRDSISGRVDSCYINSSGLSIIKDDQSDPKTFEILNLNFSQKPLDTTIKEQNIWQLIFHTGSVIGQYQKWQNNKEKTTMVLFGCYYPFTEGTNMVSGPPGIKNSHAHFSLNGNTFDTVYEINTFHKSQTSYSFNNTCFINDSIGYIKMAINYLQVGSSPNYDTIKINEVWELQRWHIVK